MSLGGGIALCISLSLTLSLLTFIMFKVKVWVCPAQTRCCNNTAPQVTGIAPTTSKDTLHEFFRCGTCISSLARSYVMHQFLREVSMQVYCGSAVSYISGSRASTSTSKKINKSRQLSHSRNLLQPILHSWYVQVLDRL